MEITAAFWIDKQKPERRAIEQDPKATKRVEKRMAQNPRPRPQIAGPAVFSGRNSSFAHPKLGKNVGTQGGDTGRKVDFA